MASLSRLGSCRSQINLKFNHHPPFTTHLAGIRLQSRVSPQQNFPRSRAALSLLSYCYYQMQDYKAATTMYEQLVKICPSVEEYKVSNTGFSLHKGDL